MIQYQSAAVPLLYQFNSYIRDTFWLHLLFLPFCFLISAVLSHSCEDFFYFYLFLLKHNIYVLRLALTNFAVQNISRMKALYWKEHFTVNISWFSPAIRARKVTHYRSSLILLPRGDITKIIAAGKYYKLHQRTRNKISAHQGSSEKTGQRNKVSVKLKIIPWQFQRPIHALQFSVE